MDNYYLYIGRLSEEKGIINLVNAWKKYVVTHSDEWLYICGDGPKKETLERILLQNSKLPLNISILGIQPRDLIFEYISKAKAVVIPSICYETGPLTMIESFSMGIPVICSDLGNMGYTIIEGENGAKFDPLSADSIVDAINRFNTYDYEKLRKTALLHLKRNFQKRRIWNCLERYMSRGKYTSNNI